MRPKCLSIAGFDGSGGAGLQADLKTFSALGCYGMTVLTALPIQNTQGVRQCYSLPLSSIKEQLDAILDDITPDSIKIGMLFQREIVELVAERLKKRAKGIPIVLDPVMVAKSGDDLLLPNAIQALKEHLIPMATVITPNLAEAATLIGPRPEMHDSAHQLLKLGPDAVLLKGGHAKGNESNDLFLSQKGEHQWLKSPRIKTQNTHGTGCTLSAAIAAFLAQGLTLVEACAKAKKYVFEALLAAREVSVGLGAGPVDHLYAIRALPEFA